MLLTVMAAACKKPYNPQVISSPNSYLVVEGVINSGGDSTMIKLSKTVNLSGNAKSNTLDNCTVTVEDDQGVSTALKPAGKGMYVAAALNIDAAKKYRLHIITPDNNEYASDYEAVKQTPPIDSVGFTTPGNTLQEYVSTHDPSNNTRYYRWDFIETWQFHSMYESDYIADKAKDTIRERTPDEQAYYCFGNDTSVNINIGTSEKLAQDVIFQDVINTVTPGTEKFGIRYSILVRQYALTKDEYQFWQNLQKTTEQLGSIFDAQPSQINGNIHNLKNAAEPVIGYISVTNVQTKRIFIGSGQYPANGIPAYPYSCGIDTAFYVNRQGENDVEKYLIQDSGFSVPVIQLHQPGTSIPAGYTYSSGFCVDCRLRGTNKTPSYWIN